LRTDPVDQDAAVVPGAGPIRGDQLSPPAPRPRQPRPTPERALTAPEREAGAGGAKLSSSAWTYRCEHCAIEIDRDVNAGALPRFGRADAVVTEQPAEQLVDELVETAAVARAASPSGSLPVQAGSDADASPTPAGGVAGPLTTRPAGSRVRSVRGRLRLDWTL
jgi:hypothetical protein